MSGSFGLAMGILAPLRVAKIRTMARPSSPAQVMIDDGEYRPREP